MAHTPVPSNDVRQRSKQADTHTVGTTGFSKHFLWGAATAAHQVEGGTHNQWTAWELENAKARAVQASFQLDDFPNWQAIKAQASNPHNYVSGRLADHYHRYEEDFDLLAGMHMNAYRFSVEWSRVEPQMDSWDPAAIQHYKDYVAALKRRDIEPVMTLFHFTLPEWFVQLGGFEKRANVKFFVRFAQKIVQEIGPDVRYIITVNEPEIYARMSYVTQEWPPAVHRPLVAHQVLTNLALAHRRVSKILHATNRRYKVSFAKNSAYYYPGDNARLSRLSAEVMQLHDDWMINRFLKGCDFLGVNYYFSNRVYGYRVHNPDLHLSDMHWDLHPADIEFVIERLYRKYRLPIMITENGLADATDQQRQWWLRETIQGMQRALKGGARIIGYLHWSLLDNFEWAYGKWPRFGLVGIDYGTGKRTMRPSAIWLSKVLKKLRGL